MAKILISGGNGMLGRALTSELLKKGYKVSWLCRNDTSEKDVSVYLWQPEKEQIDLKAFEDVDYLVNLSGSNIANKRWTDQNKKEIYNSRVKSTEFLFETIQKNKFLFQSIIGASATGYYGNEMQDIWCDEKTPAGNDFLAKVCQDWENSYDITPALPARIVILRIGIVLYIEGGMYAKLFPVFKAGLASVIGNGRNYISWIHIDDLLRMFMSAIENIHMNGVYNATATKPVTLSEFTILMAKSMNRKVWLPNVPSFLLHLLMGDRASLVYKGSRVRNDKVKSTGFEFKFSDLPSALNHLSHQKIHRNS